MKKTLSILCVVALLIGLMIPVSASAVGFAVQTTATTIKPNEPFDVTVEVSNNTGIAGGTWLISYSTGLTINSATAGTGLTPLSVVPGVTTDNPIKVVVYGSSVSTGNGTMVTLNFTAAAAGSYTIDIAADPTDIPYADLDYTDLDAAYTALTINVQSSEPAVTAKTATISSVTGGYVYASTTAWDGNTEIDLETLATSVTTAGSAAEEKVYFYFVPKAGYTANITATKDGESFDIVNGSTSKEDTLTADATYTFAFEAVTAGTPVASSIEVSNASANGVTIFGKATNATAFGALVGVSDNVKVNYGEKFAADAANADGEFVIELSGSPLFKTGKSYAAKVYATNNGTTKYSSNAAAITY